MKRTLVKRLAMRNIILLFTVIFVCAINLHGQDKFNAIQLTFDSAQEGFPTWSHDGKFIVYSYISSKDTFGNNGLWKISFDGKEAEQIFIGIAEHPKWSPDDRYIVFDADSGKSIKMIPAKGGTPISIIPDSIHIMNGGLPCWSPNGSQIAFVGGTTLTLWIININTGELSKIFQEEGMVPLPGCWSRDRKSVLIALMDIQSRKSTIWKISLDGKAKQQITGHQEGFYRHLDLSPDGSLLVYAAIVERDMGLWIMPAEGGKSLQLVAHPGFNEGACWSPDGKRIAFNSTRSGNFDVWLMDLDIERVREELQALND